MFRPLRDTLLLTGLALGLAAGPALAQAPAQAPATAAPRPATPAAPKPATPAAPKPAAPAAAAPAPIPGADPQAGPVLAAVQIPWVKMCFNVPVDQAKPEVTKQMCLISQETRAENGQFLASAQVREIEGDPKKSLIIAVPPGMMLQPGIRVVLDNGQPQNLRYEVCFPNACVAQMEINAEFVGRMKKAQQVNIQVVAAGGRMITLSMALADFGKVYDGPGTDPKEYEAQQKKLGEELQRRAEEARKKLEAQQGGAAAPALPGAPAPVVQPPKP